MEISKSGKVYNVAWVYRLWCPSCPGQFYVGSTVQLLKDRFEKHRSDCNNPRVRNYNLPVYQYIREHGSFDEWQMEVLEECHGLTTDELRQREREWYDELDPTLNDIRPWRSEEERAEQKREVARRWCEANRVADRESSRRWRETNPEKLKAQNEKCNAFHKADRVFCWICRDHSLRRDSFKRHCKGKPHLKNLLEQAFGRWRDRFTNRIEGHRQEF